MTVADETQGRPGSGADLSRRMDRIEAAQEAQAREMSSLGSDLKTFMARIEGMISGEVETSAAREGRELVADYKKWRVEVDDDREKAAVLSGRLDLLGKLAVILIGGQAFAIVAALYALARA